MCSATQASFLKLDVTHHGEAVKTGHMSINYPGFLIASKTRLKLLTRFCLNQSLDGYFQGHSKELDEITSGARVKLNRLEKAGLLFSKTQHRLKLYSVNATHSLASDLSCIVLKMSGIDALVERTTSKLPSLEQECVYGDLTKGLPSEYIEAISLESDLEQRCLDVNRLRLVAHRKSQ